MKIARLNYVDGHYVEKEIADHDTAAYRVMVEMIDDKPVNRVFQYRVGQPKDAYVIHYDEVVKK